MKGQKKMSKTIKTILWGILGIITMPLWAGPLVIYCLGFGIQEMIKEWKKGGKK